MKNIGDNWAQGNGIFETIRVEDGKGFAFHRHHCRAKEAAQKLGFHIPDEDFVVKESYQVINAEDFKLGRIRWHFELDGDFTISYTEYVEPKAPAKLMIFDERQSDFQIKNKEFPYKNLELLERAKTSGYDDGIIVRSDGQIAEASTATLLLKIDGIWVTPPLSSGILNGVVRALVLEAGLAEVQRVDIEQIGEIESALLLTSLRNAQLVGSINGRELALDAEKCAEIHKLMNEFKGR